MSFFENEEVQDIATNHVNKILKLEDAEAERIMKLYRKARQDMRDRLDTLPSGSFTAQRTRGALVQVELAIDKMSKVLKKELSGSSEDLAEVGINDLIVEINKWDKEFTGAIIPINIDAVEVASDTANFLFNKYEASINAYSEALRSTFAQGITQSAIEEISMSELVGRLSQSFLGEEWKLQRLVRTELHNVYNIGKINGMKEMWDNGKGDIPDLMKTLFHPMDKRTGDDTKRLARKNPIVPVDEPFVEYSTGKKLVYMAPPNRPNDRAILIPYRPAWE